MEEGGMERWRKRGGSKYGLWREGRGSLKEKGRK